MMTGRFSRNSKRSGSVKKHHLKVLVPGIFAAFFLIRDGHMPARNITILKSQKIEGGALDGAGNAEEGYIVRGGREMEMTYQNFWDVFSEIPALELPEPFTVLDEFRIVNDADKNWSKTLLDNAPRRPRHESW